MKFIPSEYGADPAPADPTATPTPSGQGGSPQSYTDYATAAHALLFGQDARQQSAAIQSKIDYYTDLAQKTAIGPLRNLYILEIKKLQAQKGVIDQQATEQSVSDTSAVVGKVAVSTTAVIGIGLAVLVGYNLWLSSRYLKKKSQE